MDVLTDEEIGRLFGARHQFSSGARTSAWRDIRLGEQGPHFESVWTSVTSGREGPWPVAAAKQ